MPFSHPEGVNPKRCHLIAPYTPNPADWTKIEWVDIHSNRRVRITTLGIATPTVARVKSIGDVYDEYKTHPESKSAGPGGKPCGPKARFTDAMSLRHTSG
jgi:hypothetical protein